MDLIKLKSRRATSMPTKTAKAIPTAITGKHVCLRPLARSDATAMIRLTNQSARRCPGLIRRLKGTAQFEELRKRYNGKEAFGFVICRKEDGLAVGGISLFEVIHRSRKSGVVGYLIGASYFRQGYATEALRLVLRFAFRQLKLHRVEANIQPHNVASLALVKRAGFTCEGHVRGFLKIAGKWRDHERWAILAEDWPGRRRK
jgi:ribosomal-protein-alanine N-acetyltransferase